MSDIDRTLRNERAAFRQTLVAVGPDAPTSCGSWTTTDLAVHVASGEMAAGLASAGGRALVAFGVRVDRLASANTSTLARLRRRHGFDWALARLDRDPPMVERSGPVGTVSLLEVWAHHEDVLAVHEVAPRSEEPQLDPVLGLLTRYQRGPLGELGARVRTPDRVWFEPPSVADADAGTDVYAPAADLCRWLAGRSGTDGLAITGDPEACAAVTAAVLRI